MKHSAAPVALLWVSLWAGPLQAQPIEFDAASLSLGSDEGVTESWSHTVGTGPDRLLIVGVSYQEVGGKVSSVTWNTSENFTQIGEVSNSSDATAQIWMLVNPTSGTHTVAVNLTEEGEKRRCGAVSFFHVNQTTPVGSFFSAKKKNDPAGVKVTRVNEGEVVVDTLALKGGKTATAGGEQTERWNGIFKSDITGAGSTQPSPDRGRKVTMSWSLSEEIEWAIGAVAVKPRNVTAVQLSSFAATKSQDGVLLEWQTGYEVDNLGFHVYREINGRRIRITPELISGSAFLVGGGTPLTAGHTYRWRDPEGSTSALYWLQDVDLNGERTWHGPVKPVSLQAGEKTGFSQPQEAAYSSPFLSQLGQEADPQGFIASGPSGKTRRLRSVSSEECRRRQWELAAGPALKLEIQQKVWYRVRQPQLLEAGLSPGVNPRFLQLIVGGEEEPLLVLGEEDDRFDAWDAVEFYGTGADTPWTGTRTYWLVEGEEPGKRVVGEGWSGIGSSEEPQSFSFTIEQKKRVIYAPTLKNGQQEKLFGPMIGSQPVDQVLYLHHFDRSQPEAQLEVSLQGATRKPHRVSIRVNGLELGETSFLGQQLQGATFAVPQSWLEEGNNIVTLIAQGGPTDVSLLEAIRLTYRHTYRADFDTLEFTVGKVGTDLGETDRETQPEGPSPLGEIRDSHRISSARNLVTVPNFSPTIGGFSSPWIRVVEVTDAKRPRMRAGFVHRQGEGYAITLSTPDSGPGRLLAFAESKVKQPAAIRADSPSAWHRADSGAEVVILTHRSFLDSVEPLKTLREARGYSVVVIDIEDVYDEFAFGAKTPWALKDFLTWATRQWLTPPRFVLLVGDATFDPRNHLGLGNFDFVPTRLVETELMETASDDWFVDFDLDEVPDLAIGRLPVRTAWEAERLVRKILAYEQEPGGEWRNRALIVADAPDPFSDFDKKGDALKATLPGQLALDEIYARQGEDAARTELLTKLNQGQLVVGYLGHGSVEMWSQDGLLTSRDARALTNGSRLPFLVSLTCLNGYFHHPYTESLAEALLKSRDGGALAVWASSALTPLEGQLALAQELFRLLFGGEALTLGEAVARAKAAFPDSGFSRSSDIRRS